MLSSPVLLKVPLSTELEEALRLPRDRLDLEFGLESLASAVLSPVTLPLVSPASSLWLTTSLVLSMLVTLALSSTPPEPWLPDLSSFTVMSAKFQPY